MSKDAIRAVVVDDEPLARDELSFLLGQLDVEVVAEAGNAKAALGVVEEHGPHVAFVDLRMPGPDGIALAEALKERHPELAVVVVSAHDDGALRAYEAEVLDYLLKPVRLERLKATLERVRGQLKAGTGSEVLDRLAVKRKGGYVVVDIDDVVYFHVKDELVWAVTEADSYALDLTLSAVTRRVPEGQFFRSHRSCLVRLSKIKTLEPSGTGTYELVLEHPDEPRVPLARERVRQLRALIPFAG
ncbi:MAG TPA: LytTR family DNA-binding domain-containing protein [Polyangiaceae bacterium LLY-WYZ-15_(1-7)]|nr:LytTR family DNA-binding domain-containing protein [Polyangiaceae bacterium LLY-WYZ-15_(1-7)]